MNRYPDNQIIKAVVILTKICQSQLDMSHAKLYCNIVMFVDNQSDTMDQAKITDLSCQLSVLVGTEIFFPQNYGVRFTTCQFFYPIQELFPAEMPVGDIDQHDIDWTRM